MPSSKLCNRLIGNYSIVQISSLKLSPIILSKSKNYVTSSRLTYSSFWLRMIPKPLRNSDNSHRGHQAARATKWNPSTFFIVFFLLIGSNAIQMITLKKDHTSYIRRVDAKIETIKEIIENIKNGEKVDVESILGTGIKEKESEWVKLLQEIGRGKCECDPHYQSGLMNVKDIPDINENLGKPHTSLLKPPSIIQKTGAPPGFF